VVAADVTSTINSRTFFNAMSLQRDIASEQARIERVPTFAEPIERILDPVLIDAQAVRREIAERDRGVHVPQ
jgi:hypothetical protein